MNIKKLILLLGILFYVSYAFSQVLVRCGNSVDLSADVENYSSFSWFCADANGTFSDEHNATTTFTLEDALESFKDVKFYYNANVGGSIVSDTIFVEFLKRPTPNAGEDFEVCGLNFQLNATSSHVEGDNISGMWIAMSSGNVSFTDRRDPNTTGHYPSYGTATFMWLEINHPQITIEDEEFCSASDEVVVTFYEIPSAGIDMYYADTISCGLHFEYLRADRWGGIGGYWYEDNPSTMFGENNSTVDSLLTDVTVTSYGLHDFYRIEYNGPEDNPRMCKDTAGPWTIEFVQQPTAHISEDNFVFCSLDGQLHADFNGIGEGMWSTNVSHNILTFEDRSNPNTIIHTTLLNSGNTQYPYYEIYWTVYNTVYCSDYDTAKVFFSRYPLDSVRVIPPKCYGEAAIITAYDETLPSYEWEYTGGTLDSVVTNSSGGAYRIFVHWERGNSHVVALASTNQNECRSAAIIEEPVPNYRYRIYDDPCALGKGSIEFLDTTGVYAFFWTDTDVGPVITNPDMGYPITDYRVYDLPAGRYTVRADYQTFNSDYITSYQHYFGNYACSDFLTLGIDTASIEAEIAVNSNVDNLVAPYASRVYFTNTTHYNGHMGNTICEWHFGDGDVENYCGYYYVVHDYTESGCYNPYLIVMSGDYPECRDTAFIDECLFVRNDIPDYFYDNINVFPNPANDLLNITSSEAISEIEIVNVMGQVVKRIEVNSDNVVCDVEELKAGVYVVRIYSRPFGSAQGAALRRFVKE